MNLPIEKEIELINEIISTAIDHGGDLGGAYYSDWPSLESAIGKWLDARMLSNLYTPYNNKIVPISKASIRNYSRGKDIWYLRVPAIDSKGKRVSIDQKWQEIQNAGLSTQQQGVKLELEHRSKEEFQELLIRFQQFNDDFIVIVDIIQAEFDGECELYQAKENSTYFVDSIPTKYLYLATF